MKLFKFSKTYNNFSIIFATSYDHKFGSKNHNILNISLFKMNLEIELPKFLKPYRFDNGRYYEFFQRMYGFSISDGHVFLYYGVQNHNYNEDVKTKMKLFQIPWINNTFFGKRYFDYSSDLYQIPQKEVKFFSRETDYYIINEYEKTEAPKFYFRFKECDGKQNYASCFIVERMWDRGINSFFWLKYLLGQKRERVLNIRFQRGIGTQKGSWKGSILQQGIKINKWESPFSAFLRYAEKDETKFTEVYQITEKEFNDVRSRYERKAQQKNSRKVHENCKATKID